MLPLTKETREFFKPVNVEPSDRMHVSLSRDGEHFLCKITAVDSNPAFRGVPSIRAIKTFPANVPEHKEIDGYGNWQFAATDTTAMLIHSNWPESQLVFEPDARVVYDYLRMSYQSQEKVMEGLARFYESKCVDCAKDIVDKKELPLAGYQRVGAWAASESEGYGLWMYMGTGKTATQITATCQAVRKHDEPRLYRKLVVCPRNVRRNWANEYEKFSTEPYRCTIIRGGIVERVKLLVEALAPPTKGEKYSVVIISYEMMTRMVDTLCKIEWDEIVLDESHFIKWPDSKRSKAAIKLRDAGRRRRALTGSPIANTPLDVYAQLEFMAKGASGFASWKAFRAFYGVFDRTNSGHDKLVGLQNMPMLKERLARWTYIVRSEEALPDLPPIVYDVMEVVMGPDQRKAYEDLRDRLIMEIEGMLDSDKRPIVINNALTKLLRLAQVTSGFIPIQEAYDDFGGLLHPKSVHWFTPNPKLEALIEDLKTRDPKDKTIIWAHFIPDIEAISRRLHEEGIEHVTFYGQTKEHEREEAEARFNGDPTCTVCVANAACGGTGLNLLGYLPNKPDEYDTDCVYHDFYSQGWSAVLRGQAEKRSNRKGSRRPLRCRDWCVMGSVDEQVRMRVVEKRITAFEMTDVRAIVNAVLHGVLDDE